MKSLQFREVRMTLPDKVGGGGGPKAGPSHGFVRISEFGPPSAGVATASTRQVLQGVVGISRLRTRSVQPSRGMGRTLSRDVCRASN